MHIIWAAADRFLLVHIIWAAAGCSLPSPPGSTNLLLIAFEQYARPIANAVMGSLGDFALPAQPEVPTVSTSLNNPLLCSPLDVCPLGYPTLAFI